MTTRWPTRSTPWLPWAERVVVKEAAGGRAATSPHPSVAADLRPGGRRACRPPRGGRRAAAAPGRPAGRHRGGLRPRCRRPISPPSSPARNGSAIAASGSAPTIRSLRTAGSLPAIDWPARSTDSAGVRRAILSRCRPRQPARPRPRDLGVVIGRLPPGPTDSIVDVPNVRVGHQTVWRDEPAPPAGRGVARTGVTAIVPFSVGELFSSRVPAGAAVLNGAGEAIGITTHRGVGDARDPDLPDELDGHRAGLRRQRSPRSSSSTIDAGDRRRADAGRERMRRRLAQHLASRPGRRGGRPRGADGAVGRRGRADRWRRDRSGHGHVCFELKGGIGTASRLVEPIDRRASWATPERRRAQREGPDVHGRRPGPDQLRADRTPDRRWRPGRRDAGRAKAGPMPAIRRDRERGELHRRGRHRRAVARAGPGAAGPTGRTGPRADGLDRRTWLGRYLPRVLDRRPDPARAAPARCGPSSSSTTNTSTRSLGRSSMPPRRPSSIRCSGPTPSRVVTAMSCPGLPVERTLELLAAAGRLASMSDAWGDARSPRRPRPRRWPEPGAPVPRRRRPSARSARSCGCSASPGSTPRGRPLAGTTVDRWLRGPARRPGRRDRAAVRDGAARVRPRSAAARPRCRLRRRRPGARGGAAARAGPPRRRRGRGQRVWPRPRSTRIDAERTARHETIAMLGEAPRPWLGGDAPPAGRGRGARGGGRADRRGLDLIRIEVPIGRELAARLSAAGREVPEWHPREGARGAPGRELARPGADRQSAGAGRCSGWPSIVPAPSAAATSGMATVVPALGAPEGAVVAGFERIDLIASDAIEEIVADGVEPDRALADHAFAHRLAGRAGTSIVVGPGPLVVAPDLTAGQPSDPATRAGRTLALQLVGVALARGDGLPAEQIVVGALPPWVADEPAPAARAIAEVAVRRALFADHPFAFVEPPGGQAGASTVALRPGGSGGPGRRCRVRPAPVRAGRRGSGRRRAGFATARRWPREVAASTEPGALTGLALEHARGDGQDGHGHARRARRPGLARASPAMASGPVDRRRGARTRSPSGPRPSTRSRSLRARG